MGGKDCWGMGVNLAFGGHGCLLSWVKMAQY